MNIVVTDGFTLNGGDLSWERIAQFGEMAIHDRTPTHLIEERCHDADIVVTNKTPFSREAISALPKLKCICVTATGYNVIDTKTAAEKGIVVCNVPGYGTASVVQHVFALLLELTNAVGLHSRSVRKGDWNKNPDWCYTVKPIVELSGKTIGIVGYGNIGQQVGKIADAFGMKVIYYNPSPKEASVGEQKPLDAVFAESDVVSLHCPLTPENKGMVNRPLLLKMKPNAFLINTARGPLINEGDLAGALNENIIAGAALDVLSTEPPTDAHLQLINAKNCIITPHNAWMSREARQRLMDATVENIAAFLKGQPINRVN
jgi:glycerate dehydrogenase